MNQVSASYTQIQDDKVFFFCCIVGVFCYIVCCHAVERHKVTSDKNVERLQFVTMQKNKLYFGCNALQSVRYVCF